MANDNGNHDPRDAEIDDAPAIDGEIIEPIDSRVMATLHRVEIDQQVSTAKAYPRNVLQIKQELKALVTMDEDTAEECIYALPRGNKTINGPSARFADALISFWGNSRSGAFITQVNKEEKFVEAIGSFQDVERNVIRQRRTRRPISDRNGRLYNADMINMTGNAACVIAERNAITNGIPKPFWGPIYDAAFSIVAGTTQTLGEKIARAKKGFLSMEIDFALVLERIGRADESKIVPQDVVAMRGMLTALKTGEETIESVFGRGAAGHTHDVVKDPLKDPVRGNTREVEAADLVIEKDGTISKQREPSTDIKTVLDRRFAAGKQAFQSYEVWAKAAENMPAPESPRNAGQQGDTKNPDPARPDPISSGRQGASKPADDAKPAAQANPPAQRQAAQESPYEMNAASYMGYMRDEFDKATSESTVNELWGATRNDRRELLNNDQLVELEKDKKAKVAALKLKKGGA